MPERGLTGEAQAFLLELKGAARKKLGQNFMVRENELAAIAGFLDLKEGDTVLEIGPGLGFLTRFLLEKKAAVWAVEKDALYAGFLKEHFKGRPVRVACEDVLTLDVEKTFGPLPPLKVAGNIPYNITSPILEWLLKNRKLFSQAVLTVQLEVAERLAASPGGKTWGALSIFLQMNADVDFLKKIPASAFFPSPKVDSAVVRLRFLPGPRVAVQDEARFVFLVRRAFQKRRKTLLNALESDGLPGLSKDHLRSTLTTCSIDPQRRPETLSLEEWARLSNRE